MEIIKLILLCVNLAAVVIQVGLVITLITETIKHVRQGGEVTNILPFVVVTISLIVTLFLAINGSFK